MDANHALGCSLLGLAFTAALARFLWLGSPPFNSMVPARLKLWKNALIGTTVVFMLCGMCLLSKPESPGVAERNAEEGFQFH